MSSITLSNTRYDSSVNLPRCNVAREARIPNKRGSISRASLPPGNGVVLGTRTI